MYISICVITKVPPSFLSTPVTSMFGKEKNLLRGSSHVAPVSCALAMVGCWLGEDNVFPYYNTSPPLRLSSFSFFVPILYVPGPPITELSKRFLRLQRSLRYFLIFQPPDAQSMLRQYEVCIQPQRFYKIYSCGCSMRRCFPSAR